MPNSRFGERLRREQTLNATSYYRTLSAGDGHHRVASDDVTPERVFAALWPLTDGSRLRMRRHRVDADGVVWDVNELLDQGLVIAAVESGPEEPAPALPAWIEPVLDRDVTGDEAFDARSLAR